MGYFYDRERVLSQLRGPVGEELDRVRLPAFIHMRVQPEGKDSDPVPKDEQLDPCLDQSRDQRFFLGAIQHLGAAPKPLVAKNVRDRQITPGRVAFGKEEHVRGGQHLLQVDLLRLSLPPNWPSVVLQP